MDIVSEIEFLLNNIYIEDGRNGGYTAQKNCFVIKYGETRSFPRITPLKCSKLLTRFKLWYQNSSQM